MPPGSRRPRSRRELMRAFMADPRLSAVRADHADNLVATIRILVRAASWNDSDADPRATARPTRARVTEMAGYCLSTWKACRRLLEQWGWLRLLRAGRSEEARRKSPDPALAYDGNDAAVYLLIIPRVPRTGQKVRQKHPGPPAPSASRVTRPPPVAALPHRNPARPGENRAGQEQRRTALRAGSLAKPACWLALQGGGPLEKLSERAALRLWRPFEARGWSVAAWRRAFDWRPDSTQWAGKHCEVRYPSSWAAWRLSFWLGPDGQPVVPPLMQAAVDRQPDRAAAAARRAELAAAAAAAVPPGSHFDQLREQRGWRRNGRTPP